MKYPNYSGQFFLGIVISNNDVDRAGKVQVFIPHISVNIYKGWNELPKDRKFKFVGRNIQSDLSDIIDDLRRFLPWAVQASPLAGESSKGRYSEYLKSASISDSNKLSTFVDNTSSTIPTGEITQYSQNLDNIGEKPGFKYDLNYFKLADNFSDTNKFSQNYIPETLSNCAKGVFGIPAVGSHVWCFFDSGDVMRPIYFATSFGKEDWQGIYECSDTEPGLDYPGAFENIPTSIRTIDSETYRSKFVVNQKGGTFQIVNSDNRECLKFTHFSGSFKEFNNYTNIELATKNDQKLVLGNAFQTYRGSLNVSTEKEFNQIIKGDHFKKIGNLDNTLISQWKLIVSNIASVKQLFETRQTQANSNTSNLQQRIGSFTACPVCRGSKVSYYKLNNIFTSVNVGTANSSGDGPYNSGTVTPTGKQLDAQLGKFTGNGIVFSDTCPSCKGSGISTSSFEGKWQVESRKTQLNTLINSKLTELALLESQMGVGGSEIIDIAKHKHETIGLLMNDFGSIRLDSVGKIANSSINIATDGVYTNQTASPLLEYVQVDDLPGGNYNLNVCNRYSLLVGAGGISIKTYGPVNISGTIVNLVGEQVNISSANEVNIDGGKRLNLTADIVSLKQRNGNQVLIDSNLGVNKNVVIGGGTHIEGELTINHITAPVEVQQTEQTTVYAAAVPGKIIGTVIIGNTSYPVYGTGREEDSIKCYTHSHNFKNLPLTLVNSNNDVRIAAKANNNTNRVPAKPIDNSKK